MTLLLIFCILLVAFVWFWTGRNAIKKRREMKYPSATRPYHKDNEARLTDETTRKVIRLDDFERRLSEP